MEPETAKMAKESPLNKANAALSEQITGVQDEVDMLFSALHPVLSPEHPTDNIAAEGQLAAPERSVQVMYVESQTDRLSGVRQRLSYLRSRLEV